MALRALTLCFCLTVAGAASAGAQTPSAAGTPAAGVASNLPATGWISPTDPIVLTMPRSAIPAGARLAVFIGRTDWTAVFGTTAEGLEYRPRTLTLPSGEQELIVYAVSPANVWTELARFALRVRTRGGFEKADTVPAMDIGLRSQMFEGHDPADNAPGRATYRDTTVTTGFKATLVRGRVQWDVDAGVVGVSHRPEALRFALRGENAPRVDLSSYSVKVSSGRASALVGHLAFGRSRHLINGFASRGVSFMAPLGARGDVTFIVANGTSIVGWSNPLGLDDGDHRVMGGSVGVELVGGRPGGLRLEGTILDGSLRPATSFTQGAITDAETSRGLSGRVIAADAKNRVRIDGGYTRSRFTNPFDPLLAQGTPIVPVQESAHNARYLDTALDLVQNAGSGRAQTTVTALFRHERVDPLFRSVGGSVQADRQENTFEAQARIGEATAQATHMRMHDNLEEIPSILKSNTQRNAMSAAVPLAAFFGAPAASARWAPRVGYTFDRVHQAGRGIPENSGFSATHVPDQVSLNQTVTVDWERPKFRAGYRLNRSLQDNRHVGQERADLLNITNAVTASVSAGTANVTVDVGFDRARNRELLTLDRTRRLTLIGDWRMTSGIGLTSNASITWLGDDRRTSASRAIDFTVEGFWEIAFRRTPVPKPAARLFLRYARQSGRIENFQFGVPLSLRTGWTVNGGVNVSVF